jgi:cell division septation protein DedD
MSKSILLLLSLPVLAAAQTPQQSLQDDLRNHPWQFSIASMSASPSVGEGAEEAHPAPQAGTWEIQVGALSSQDAALKRKQELEAVLGTETVRVVPQAGSWKLRWGSFPNRKAAQKGREELKKKGIDGFPIAP